MRPFPAISLLSVGQLFALRDLLCSLIMVCCRFLNCCFHRKTGHTSENPADTFSEPESNEANLNVLSTAFVVSSSCLGFAVVDRCELTQHSSCIIKKSNESHYADPTYHYNDNAHRQATHLIESIDAIDNSSSFSTKTVRLRQPFQEVTTS